MIHNLRTIPMKKNTLTIGFLFFATFGVAQEYEKSSIKMVSHSVAFLSESQQDTLAYKGKTYEVWYKEKGKSTYIPKVIKKSGSSFFVTDTIASVYIVTAAHVAKEMTLNSDIVINGPKDTPLIYKLRDFAFRKDSLTWNYHKTADVAALLIDVNAKCYLNSNIDAFPFYFIERERIPVREREVTTVGFPFSLGYEKYFSPISKVSKPSSGLIELPRFDNNIVTPFFLLDDPSIRGFSGSPVFELPANLIYGGMAYNVKSTALMGLIHGSYGDNSTYGGLTAVVPSKAILEVIEKSPKFSGYRTQYHTNGKIWGVVEFKNGVLWKAIANFDSNGKPMEKGNLTDGNGTLFLYNPDGNLREIQHYEKGILVKSDAK